MDTAMSKSIVLWVELIRHMLDQKKKGGRLIGQYVATVIYRKRWQFGALITYFGCVLDKATNPVCDTVTQGAVIFAR